MADQYISYSSRNSGTGGGVTSLNAETGAVNIVAGPNITVTPSGQNITIGSTSGGTVTSVGLADSTGLFNITGSPVTSSGTLTLSSFQNQAQNSVFAGPSSGGAGVPTFRALVSADIPSLSGSYANTALSNLASVAFNADLLPGANNVRKIGDATHKILSIDVTTIQSNGVSAISVGAHTLLDNTGNSSLDFGNRQAFDSTTALSLNYETRVLIDTLGNNVALWDTQELYDPAGIIAISWRNRELRNNAGGLILDFSTAGVASFNNNLLSNVLDPVSAQDAATKNYVDINTGAGITSLTGDVTATGPGAAAATLATVNGNVGSFGSSTSIPNFTVNAKGLITAAGSNAVIAPAGTLTGTTLAANVVSSSLTSVGTIASGTWNGTTIAVAKGGTSLSALTLNNVILGNGTSAPSFVAPGTSGNLLTSNGTTWTSSAPATNGTVTSVAATVPAFLSIAGSPITSSGTLAISLSGTALPIANGGTGQVTANAAFNALSPMTTGGDLIYGGASGVGTRLANGTAGQILQSQGGTAAPQWSSALLPAANFFASSQVTTGSSPAINSTTFTTFSNSPAFTFVPTTTGKYKVYGGFPLFSNSNNTVAVCRVFNTTGGATLLHESRGSMYASASTSECSTFTSSVYTLTAGVTYVFDIQGAYSTGGGIAGDVYLNGDLASFYMFAELCASTGANGYAINSISSNTTAGIGNTYLADTSGGAFNLTLPTPVLNGFIMVKDSTGSFGTNNLTIVRSGSEKIEGVAASKVLQTNWGSFTFLSNGTDWFMV